MKKRTKSPISLLVVTLALSAFTFASSAAALEREGCIPVGP